MNPITEELNILSQGLASSAPWDVALLGVAFFSLLGFMASLLLYFKSQRIQVSSFDTHKELTGGLRGRLEKLEMELNSLRTETARNSQFGQTELLYLRKQIFDLKKHLKIEVSDLEEKLNLKKIESQDEDLEDIVSKKDLDESSNKEDVQEVKNEEILDPDLVQPLEVKIAKTKENFFSRLKKVFKDRNDLDDLGLDEIEEILVGADIGVKTSMQLIAEAREMLESGKLITKAILLDSIKNKISNILSFEGFDEYPVIPIKKESKPYVVLLLGVNGAGKTTTAAKLAYRWSKEGKKVILGAADTFRAAAVEQLVSWGNQMDVPVVLGSENAKPATVVFDVLDRAEKENADVVIIDTAGRLHNKANLMQELEGINNVIKKKLGSDADETLLVIDGTSGQNGLIQAKEFNSVIPLSGIIVTKLDGTPKGGIVIAIKAELGIPVRYIGVGESKNGLRVFNSKEFSEAIFGVDDKTLAVKEFDEAVS